MRSTGCCTLIALLLFSCGAYANRTTPTEVINTPTVSIDPANNVVKTPAQQAMVQLWTIDQGLGSGMDMDSAPIDCTGYRELRIVIVKAGQTLYASDWNHVKVTVLVRNLNDVYMPLGSGDFTSNAGIVTGGNFQPLVGENSHCCVLSMPVISDKIKVNVRNYASAGVLVSSGSYVYLTN